MRKFLLAALAVCIVISAMCPFVTLADAALGENITWNLTDGTLTITGSGDMADFSAASDAPWYANRAAVERIVVSDGITHIGSMAFYGCVNAKTAEIADSVKSIGINAFSYTEGSVTSISSVSAPYQFVISSEEDCAKAGEEFYVDVDLKGDFKGVSAIQAMVIFDSERISADVDDWCDTAWLESVDKTGLGYISNPMNGVVTNTVRVLYISLGGTKIDDGSPLYTAGETTQKVARLKFKAKADIEAFDITCFYLKDCKVVNAESKTDPECGLMQLTTSSILPISGLKIITNSKDAADYATDKGIKAEDKDGKEYTAEAKPETKKPDGITVMLDGKKIEFDVEPILVKDRTMVPMRAIFEALGAKVDWDNDKQTAFGMNSDTVVAFQIDNNKMQKSSVDGKSETIELDVPAMLVNDRTLVPLRAISESFGNKVDWVDETQTVIITSEK